MQSSNEYFYYMHFMDKYSRLTWIYLLRNKFDAFQTFLNFHVQAELQLGYKLKIIQVIRVVNIEYLLVISKLMALYIEFLVPIHKNKIG